jgi:proteasome lid subunit RPN8/RPN11
MRIIMEKKDENIQEPEIEEESKVFRVIKKIILFIISIFLLFLILSYLLPFNLLSIIPSQLNSYEINNDEITLKNNDLIIFENDTYDELLEFYNNNQQHEFKACLVGNKEDKLYKIEKIEIPVILSQDFSSVRAIPCTKETIISLHSHPFKSCYFSVHDINSYRLVKNINGEALIGIMCEPARFNFYGFG